MTKTHAETPHELFDQAVRLADRYETNFVELGEVLRKLQDENPSLFKEVYTQTRLGYRKATYLVKIARQTADLPINKSALAGIGWTKAEAIGHVLTLHNWEFWLGKAKAHTAHDLKAMVKGERPLSGSRSILLRFAPADYERLVKALLAHGATPNGPGLKGRETALLAMIAKLEANDG